MEEIINVKNDVNRKTNLVCENLLIGEIFSVLSHPLRVDCERYFFELEKRCGMSA
jgi:hypothetical protein